MENLGDQGDIGLIFSIMVGKVSMAINRKLYRDFKSAGLEFTPEQWTVLYCLWNKDGVTQQELCNRTFKDKPSMTRLIDNLEKQNYVVRIADVSDRRTNMIYLTHLGKESRDLANEVVLKAMSEAFESVPKEESELAKQILNIVFENLKVGLV
ncbi:MAG: MarR family transcriptional regulator [Dysgonamonadaceae bacterium]|jgi:DNA-binding MarR family transcriptional regulator|nr:MarR family transcriptional regulator [Dysgonamonadaceae bacterium]